MEEILVDYHNIFARHRVDIGMNTQFKVKLTPKNKTFVHSPSLPMPLYLKQDLTVEFALVHKHGMLTLLPFSKLASPIFAQRKPNVKHRLLVDIRKINRLILDDNTKNNHIVNILSDVAEHLAGNYPFCSPNCSQAFQ